MLVRTIGGGEPWDNTVGISPVAGNETIKDVLAGREAGKNAVAGQDYQILNKEIVFQVNSVWKK